MRAGDPAAIANIARALQQPYLKVTRVRFTGAEFVEVTNLGGGGQDLAGWTVRVPERGLRFALPADVRLEPGQSCWLYSTATSTPNVTGQCRAVTGALPGTLVGQAELDLWPDDAGRVVLYYDALDLLGDDTRYSADSDSQPPPPYLHLVGARP